MLEKSYYEQKNIWIAERWLDGPQRERLMACVDALPLDIESLLDVGAGIGAFLSLVEQHGPKGLRTIGLERSQTALHSAVCQSPLYQGSVEALPYEDRSFDLVSALQLIEHLPWGIYEKALDELSRIAGRYVLINVPYSEHRLRAHCPYCDCQFSPHFHMHSFSDVGLQNLLPGFKRVAMYPIRTRENLLRIVTLPFRRRIFGNFPPYAICPQCGFRESSGTGGFNTKKFSGVQQFLRLAIDRFPHVLQVTEVIALYKRQD